MIIALLLYTYLYYVSCTHTKVQIHYSVMSMLLVFAVPCSPGTFGIQSPDLTWDCTSCGPNAVAGRFATNHVCTVCNDGTQANEDHTICIGYVIAFDVL
jgi:hypothetical protein